MPPMEDGAQMGVKTSLVGLNTVEAMKRKQAHKRRGVSGAASSAFLQTPEQFLEALDRTQYVTDVILQPADRSRKRGADYEDRLDYRLQTIGVDKVASNEEEDIGESWHQPVAKLSLEKKVFATLRRQEGKHLYAVDFCTRTYPCKITIECWSMADSSGVRFYVKKGELPTPASFDWWSPGNGKIEIGADDAADQFGKYYITVLAMGSNATYMLTARYAVHRPPVATEHTRAAERMVKDSVKRHISQSSQRAFASRYGRKTMSADHRDKLQPRPRLRGPRDLGVGGQRTTPVTAGFSAHGTSTTTCISQRPASGVSPDPARQELFSDPKISPEAEKELVARKCDFFEKKFMGRTTESFEITSRAVSIKASAFNPPRLREALSLVHQITSASKTNQETLENSVSNPHDICDECLKRSLMHSIVLQTRHTGLRLTRGMRKESRTFVDGSPILNNPSLTYQPKPRSKAQWAVSTEDPRLRKLIGKEGLPRRLSILRDDAVDFRTHSFQDGFFRLSLVGALEMSTDQRADREEVKDVQYTHVAQVQRLQSAFPIALTDQPSNLHCFQLEFPLDDDNTSAKTSVLARGNPDPDSNEPRRITLAAHSAEERDKWLGALNLFCKLTAAERARASRSAAFQKQLRKKAREEKLDDMEIGRALASTADPTPHVPKATTTSTCLFPAQLAQATDVQDVVPNQDGIPVFEEPAEKQTGDGTSESLTSGENSAVAWHPEAVLKPTLGTFLTSEEAVVVAEAWQAPEDSFMISDVFRGMPIEHRRPTSAVPWRPTSPAIRKQQPMRPTSALH